MSWLPNRLFCYMSVVSSLIITWFTYNTCSVDPRDSVIMRLTFVPSYFKTILTCYTSYYMYGVCVMVIMKIYSILSAWFIYRLFYNLSPTPENQESASAKTKAQNNCAVTAQLIRVFIFATQIVQFLFFLNPKFQASNLLL